MNTLLTVDEFKLFFPSSSLTDIQIELYCEIITEYVHNLAGVSLEEGEITERLKGNNQKTIYLKKRPIKSITSLEGNRTHLSDVVINNTKNGIERVRGVFYQGQDIFEPYMASQTTKSETIEIKYIGGWKYPEEVPKTLKYALAGMIQSFADEQGQEGKLKAYSRDDVSYTFKDSIERNKQFVSIIWSYL